MKNEQPKLCPNCPLISLLPIIMSKRVTYTREKEQLTPHRICQLLRALWLKHPYVTLEGCPYFAQTERIDFMPQPQRKAGKFWSHVRSLIWEKAQELYQMEQAKTMKSDFKGLTATRKELREGGYFQTAKLIVLRNLWLQRKGLSSTEEETITRNSILQFKNQKPQNNKRKGV